ncbi:hypothetical protein DFP77_14130 [Marinomonas foliarum]|uniref:Uncharacterized protein n=1 Tax=Marinomonas foliarum TaxID=491950 RepID=A0A368ZL08_9GAMM|nr:hypothetical protein DFP77_14130 [Marinomonas foliarum]
MFPRRAVVFMDFISEIFSEIPILNENGLSL